jgi:hypothetical protein
MFSALFADFFITPQLFKRFRIFGLETARTYKAEPAKSIFQ